MVDLADLGKRRRRGKAKKPAVKKKGGNQGRKKGTKASAKKAENTNTNANTEEEPGQVDLNSSMGIFCCDFFNSSKLDCVTQSKCYIIIKTLKNIKPGGCYKKITKKSQETVEKF